MRLNLHAALATRPNRTSKLHDHLRFQSSHPLHRPILYPYLSLSLCRRKTKMTLATAHLRIARPTNNLEALLPFYCNGLGFSQVGGFVDHAGFDGIMLSLGNPAGYHLEFTRCRDHDAGRAPTQDNLLVFYLPDARSYEDVVAKMVSSGFPPVASFNPYWDSCGKTFEDPDGYRVVLVNMETPV